MLAKSTKVASHTTGPGAHRAVMACTLWILTFSSLVVRAQQATDPAVEIKKLTDKKQGVEVREGAATALAHVGVPTDAIARALATVLRDKEDDGRVRKVALEALASIGHVPSARSQVVMALAQTLQQRNSAQNSAIRTAAARAMGKILQTAHQPDDLDLINPVLQVLQSVLTRPNEDLMVRADSAWGKPEIEIFVSLGETTSAI